MIGEARTLPSMALAGAAASTRWDRVPEAVRSQTIDLILDVLAVAAYGGTHPEMASFRQRAISGPGKATVVGWDRGVPVATAALLNGAATTVHQLQDGHRMARGHPASHVVPAAFAVAEDTDASAEQFLVAVIAGYEVAARIGMALGGVQEALHDAGTWGTIGAAVASAYLLAGPDPARLAEAIEGAAAVALFPYRETAAKGATIHHLYIGLGCSTGVTVAQAVAAGLGALAGTLADFFGPRAGADFDPARLVAGIDAGGWAEFEMLNNYFKIHPTCAHMHCVNDLLQDLARAPELARSAVDRVDVWLYGHAMEYSNAAPQNDLAARFSIPAAVAVALARGGLAMDGLGERDLRDEAVASLAERVYLHHDPELDRHYPAGRPGRVRLCLADGTVLERAALYPRGDVANPIGRDERRDKARRLLGKRFGTPGADTVIGAVEALASGGPLSAVSAGLRKST
jgi:2-methylcitrate dehydratase PrpD